MKDKSTYYREDSPANLFQSQGEEEERRMTAISGRRCLEQSPKSSQITYLVKMLVESSRWYHPLMMLRWVAKPIYSEKVTRYTKNMADSLPTSSVQTLSEKVTPSKSLLYQLVPSVRHTEGIGFGLLPNGLLPTQRANKVTDVNLANQRIADRDKGNLEEVIAKYVMTGNGLLPTPTSAEIEHKQRITDLKQMGGATMYSRANGAKRPNGLTDAVLFNLPTPCARDWKGLQACEYKKARGEESSVNWGGSLPAAVQADGEVSQQLNPLFVEEMMGFPKEWILQPFLLRDGEGRQ